MTRTSELHQYRYIHPSAKISRRLPLPLMTRLRLRVKRRIDLACGWLCEHGRDNLAVLIWRVCGMWP